MSGINETVGKYDWRKVRQWIGDANDVPFSLYTSRPLLMPTQDEINWWNEVIGEVSNVYKNYTARSYAFLAHLKLGRIISLTSLKLTDILEREKRLYIQFNYGRVYPLEENENKVIWKKANVIVRDVATRTLNGDIPSPEELSKRWIEYMSTSRMHGKKVERESHDSVVWHRMIQLNEGIAALPYIGLISEDEARKAIDAFLEDRVKEIKEIKDKILSK